MEWALCQEVELANDLNLNEKIVSKVLRYLEQHHLVVREHAREMVQKEVQEDVKKEDDDIEQRPKTLIFSYSMIDYARFADYARLRLHKMRRKLRDELEEKSRILDYWCPNPRCGQHFTDFDAPSLLDFRTGTFKCRDCQTELTTGKAKDKGAEVDVGAKRKAEIKALLEKFDSQLAPLLKQLKAIENVRAPGFMPLTDWIFELNQARKQEMARLSGQAGATPSGRGHGNGAYHGLQSVDGDIPDATQVSVELKGDFEGANVAPEPEAVKPQPVFLTENAWHHHGPVQTLPQKKQESPAEEDSYERWLREEQKQPENLQPVAEEMEDLVWENVDTSKNSEAKPLPGNGAAMEDTMHGDVELDEEWEDV
eukprot:scaffold824_cov327-Pavlova_lutheri.AAC.30